MVDKVGEWCFPSGKVEPIRISPSVQHLLNLVEPINPFSDNRRRG
ncbi:hypothetical protein SAMN06264849_10724 [Melghirimyces algeriensis]|uniref:Uncharacterized protein n=1 Tax=Melghirimyces algeriensis TaxID=910412 RepID=A0A521DVY1_9BACL|nr:hypothetical protein SAMN06264849_10724 [Melghirimyces algeriensis]